MTTAAPLTQPLSASSTGSGSMSSDSAESLELPVWLDGQEKWVTGLTRRTTCDDVIYALLAHTDGAPCQVDVAGHVMYERWRGVERPLRGRTKVLKVWRAWGAETPNVRLFVKRGNNMLDTSSEVSRAKGVRRHHSTRRDRRHRNAHDTHPRHPQQASDRLPHHDRPHPHHRSHPHEKDSSQERHAVRHANKDLVNRDSRFSEQSRSNVALQVPSNFPDPITDFPQHQPHSDPIPSEPVPQDSGQAPDSSHMKTRAFQELVNVILEQERRVQEQLSRLKDTDVQIERYETAVHAGRVRDHGQDYVQRAYLKERSEDSSSGPGERSEEEGAQGLKVKATPNGPGESIHGGEEMGDLFPAIKASDLEAYTHICDNILELEERISAEQNRIQDLALQIQDESHHQGDTQTLPPGGDNTISPLVSERDVWAEIERLRGDFERSASLTEAQQQQLELVTLTLEECEENLRRKQGALQQLEDELRYEHQQARLGLHLEDLPEPPPFIPDMPDLSDMSDNSDFPDMAHLPGVQDSPNQYLPHKPHTSQHKHPPTSSQPYLPDKTQPLPLYEASQPQPRGGTTYRPSEVPLSSPKDSGVDTNFDDTPEEVFESKQSKHDTYESKHHVENHYTDGHRGYSHFSESTKFASNNPRHSGQHSDQQQYQSNAYHSQLHPKPPLGYYVTKISSNNGESHGGHRNGFVHGDTGKVFRDHEQGRRVNGFTHGDPNKVLKHYDPERKVNGYTPGYMETNHYRKVNGYVDADSCRKVNGYNDNDSNSDTGLSSLHSDDAPPALETLV